MDESKVTQDTTFSTGVIRIEIPPVEKWTLRDLKSVCHHNKIKGYAKMEREQLVRHVKKILGHE